MHLLRILLSFLLSLVAAGSVSARLEPLPAQPPAGGVHDEARVLPAAGAESLRSEIDAFHRRTGLYFILVTREYPAGSSPDADSAESHRLWIEPHGSGVVLVYDAASGNVGFSASRGDGFPPPDVLQEILTTAGQDAAAHSGSEPDAKLFAFALTILNQLTVWHEHSVRSPQPSGSSPATQDASAESGEPPPGSGRRFPFTRVLRIALILFCLWAGVRYIREVLARRRAAAPAAAAVAPPAAPAAPPEETHLPGPAPRTAESPPVPGPAANEGPPAPPPPPAEQSGDGAPALHFPEVTVGRRLGAPLGGGVVAVVPPPERPGPAGSKPEVRTEAPAPATTQA